MYKVVIIDDEERIVTGLKSIIEWESYGCKVVGTAHDGVAGQKLIREQKPDIVLTDICMPKSDGLKMLLGIKSEFPNMQVTILSGHNDFEYAREALRLGVRRYLLKPSRMKELIEAVETMVQSLNGGKEPDDGSIISDKEAASFVVRKALLYIENHYNEKITLNDVADEVFVSHWHLSKLLHKHTDKSFYDIINSTRIEKAKQLLYNPQYKVNEIGYMVGYADGAHFSKVFKKETGMSANQYRSCYCG